MGAAVDAEAVVLEGDVEGVFDGGVIAVAANAGGDRFGDAEEGEALVDEMGAEVHQQAVGAAVGFLPGSLFGRGPEAVEVGLKGDDAAEGVFVEELFDCQEVAIPAAVVEGREDQTFAGGEIDEVASFGGGGGEGFIDDDVLAGVQGFFAEVEVGLVGGADDDELHRGIAEGLPGGAEDAGIGIGLPGFIAFALDDGLEP